MISWPSFKQRICVFPLEIGVWELKMESDTGAVRFRCIVHHPEFADDGTESQSVLEGSGVQLLPTSLCSSLAADVLSDMFQKQEIDGKIIMKADNAKGEKHSLITAAKPTNPSRIDRHMDARKLNSNLAREKSSRLALLMRYIIYQRMFGKGVSKALRIVR